MATSLLLIPEAWELTKSVSVIKVGALVINLFVVAYLLWRLRGSPRTPAAIAAEPAASGSRAAGRSTSPP